MNFLNRYEVVANSEVIFGSQAKVDQCTQAYE